MPIINLNHVVKLKTEGVIKLSNGEELNVSRSRMPEFRRALAAEMYVKIVYIYLNVQKAKIM